MDAMILLIANYSSPLSSCHAMGEITVNFPTLFYLVHSSVSINCFVNYGTDLNISTRSSSMLEFLNYRSLPNILRQKEGPLLALVLFELLLPKEASNSAVEKYKSNLLSQFQQYLAIDVNEDIFIGILGGKFIEIWEAYGIKDKVIKTLINRFTTEDGANEGWDMFLQYQLISKAARRSNFGGAMVTSVSDLSNPTLYLRREAFSNEDINLNHVTPLIANVYLDLKTLLHFRSRILLGTADLINDPGNDAHYGVEFTLQFLITNLDRAKDFKLLQPLLDINYEIFFQNPNINSIRNVHISPFKFSLWICLLITWSMIFACIVCIIIQGNKAKGVSTNTNDHRAYGDALWWTVILFLMQDNQRLPSSTSTSLRTGLVTGGILAMITHASYSAVIVSTIITVPISPIREVQDMIDFNYMFTAHLKSKPLQDILQGLIVKYNLPQEILTVDSANQIPHLIKNGKKATIAYRELFFLHAFAQNYSDEVLCSKITSMASPDPPLHSSIVMKKDSKLVEFFNYRIQTIMERGLLARYTKQRKTTDIGVFCKFEMHPTLDQKRLNIRDALLPFLILGIGASIAAIITLADLLLKSVCN